MSSTSALLNFSASAGERDGGLADATPRVENARALKHDASQKLVDGADPDVVVSPAAAPTEAWMPNASRAFDSPKATARLDASARRHADAPGDAIAREPEPSAKEARRRRKYYVAAGGARTQVLRAGEARHLREPRARWIRTAVLVSPTAVATLTPSRVLRAHARASHPGTARARTLGPESLPRVQPFALAVRGVHLPRGRPGARRSGAGQGLSLIHI